jgi:taurine dioxygenase
LAQIGKLMDHATQTKYEWRHQWRQGDWAILGTRSVTHQPDANYDTNER